MKPWLFVINDRATLKPTQSTAGLIAHAVAREIPVWVAEVNALESQPDGRLTAGACRVSPKITDTRGVARSVREAQRRRVELDEYGLVLVRTNPGRDPRTAVHESLLDLLEMVEERGVPVLNAVRGLRRARSKLYLQRFPPMARPETLVTASAKAAREFIDAQPGSAVIKPLVGTQGRDVFLIDERAAPNLNALLDVVLRDGPAIIQAKAESDRAGDTRILMMDGELLEVDGQPCAVRRVPRGAEFRSNHHVGAQVETPALQAYHRRLVKAVGPILRKDGLFLVGLDTVGDKIIECNVFAPGGVGDAADFGGVDFLSAIIDGAARHALD